MTRKKIFSVLGSLMISSCCSSASDSGLNSLTALKEAVLIAIRTPPPTRSDRSLLNIVRPECSISELLIFWFNYVSLTHITSEFSAYTRSWKRWFRVAALHGEYVSTFFWPHLKSGMLVIFRIWRGTLNFSSFSS